MDKPIRVLAVVFSMRHAGLETRLMDIIRNINRERVIIDVFSYQLNKGVFDDEIVSLGGKVYYNPPLTPKNMFWYVRYFRDFLLSHPEYKIVHAHQDAWCSVFCKGAYLAGVPVRIAHSRTAISGRSLNYMAKNIIKIPARKYANYYFAVSEKAGRWLFGDKLVDSGKVMIWPNAIDARNFYFNQSIRDEVRAENGWENDYVIIHVGNYTHPKNHPFIFDVFESVLKKKGNAKLVLAGSGDKQYLETCLAGHDFGDRISLLGSRSDVNKILQGADVFFFPSIFEGLPGALVEAQAAGLPCVISDSIADEVRILPSLVALSLNDDKEKWVSYILDEKDFRREDARKYVEEKGFDVNNLVVDLCAFYEDSLSNKEEEE